MLSIRPIVFVGLISYSLYLWHWPLIVFQRTDALFFNELSGLTRTALIAAMIGIAFLSWKFVEMPFRAKGREVSRYTGFQRLRKCDRLGASLCGLILLVGGAPFRFPDRVVAIGSYLALRSQKPHSAPGNAISRPIGSCSMSRAA